MDIHVTAWRRSREREDSEKVTCATFSFVALDQRWEAAPGDALTRFPSAREDRTPKIEEPGALVRV